jgi:hypothetical protein
VIVFLAIVVGSLAALAAVVAVVLGLGHGGPAIEPDSFVGHVLMHAPHVLFAVFFAGAVGAGAATRRR